MHWFFVAVAVSALSVFTVSEAKTRLLLEVSRGDITGDEIHEFLSRAIRSANSTTNITASVSDVNECDSFTLNTCSEYAKCINLVGSFSCECPPTFFDDSEETPGTNCSDIDECLDGTHNCGENSDCVNTIGGFNCSCLAGFSGNGTNCWDVDECADPAIHNCSRDADCVNNVGNYSCSCKTGFTGDGFSCTKKPQPRFSRKCNAKLICHENSYCLTLSVGKFVCPCLPGYKRAIFRRSPKCVAISTTTEHTTAHANTIATSSAPTTEEKTSTQTQTDTTDEITTAAPSSAPTTTVMTSTQSLSTDTTEEITTTVTSDTTILRNDTKHRTATNKPMPITSQHTDDTTSVTPAESTQERTNEMPTDLTTSKFNDSTTTSPDSSPTEYTTALYESSPITTSSTSTVSPAIRTDPLPLKRPHTTDTTGTSTSAQFVATSQTSASVAELTTSDVMDGQADSGYTANFFLDDTSTAQFSSSSATTIKSSVSTRKEFDSTASVTSTGTHENINADASDDVTHYYTISTVISLTSTSENTAFEPKTTPRSKRPVEIVSTLHTTTATTDEDSMINTVISEYSTETSTSQRQTESTLVDITSTSTITTNADLTTTSPHNDVTSTTNPPQGTTSQSSTQETTVARTSSESSSVPIASSTTSSAPIHATSTSHITTETISTDSTSEIWTSTDATSSTAATTLSPTTVETSTETDATSSSNIEQSSTDEGTVEATTATFQTTDIAVSETTQAPFSTGMISSDTVTLTAGYSTNPSNTTTITNEITSTPPPLKPPRYDGNRTKYLDSLQNLLSDLTNDPSQKIDITEASSTIDDFETLILDGDADENLVDITTDVVMAFFNASVENGEVKMTANDSEKITKFVPNVLESMQLATGVYNKIETDLALQALDVNLTISDPAVFKITEGSVVLPNAFVGSATNMNSSETPTKGDQRVAFTRYSDSRFFAASNVGLIMSGSEVPSANLPAKSSIINSPVIGATVQGRNIIDSVQEATIRLNLLVADPLETSFDNGTKEIVSYTANPRCVWWNYELRDWSDSGCVFQGLSNGTATCKCNHLTSFAVIMTVEKTVEDQVLSYLSYIGAGLSIVGLALTILTYSMFRTLRKSRSKRILLHFCIALCGVYITYVLGIAAKLPANQSQCTASGFFMHFFTLSVMAWMSVEVFDMYIMFVKIMQISIHKYLLKASLIAWLAPLVAAIIPLIVHLSTPGTGIYPIYHDGATVCWLGQTGMLYAFIIPSSIILLANLVLFTIVVRSVTCKRSDRLVGRIGRRSGKNIKASQHVINALALLLLAGPTWIIGYLINVEPVEDGVLRRILSYVFVILNAFQGFWIFIVFCIRPPSVRNKWVNLIRRGRLDDHSRPYFSSSSQRNTTKVTSMSPRPSLFPDSTTADETNTASNRNKTAVINTNSSSSSNSNNSNSRVSTHSSTSPLASTGINKQPQKFMPRGNRSLGLDIRIWNGSQRCNSISSADCS